MSAFPNVELNTPFIAQTEYKSGEVDVLQIDDNTVEKRLRVFCQLGDNPSFKYWVTVSEGDAYDVNWSNEDVANAIKSFFVNQ